MKSIILVFNDPSPIFSREMDFDDFEILAARQNWQIERRYFLSGTREVKSFPNLMAEVAVFVVSNR